MANTAGEPMKEHYDFSQGERGKFYQHDVVLKLPVYLDQAVEDYLAKKATAKGIELSDLVNDLLKKDIELIEVGK